MGAVAGILVMCTIGFVILLVMFLSGGSVTKPTTAVTGPTVAAQPTAPAQPTTPGTITMRAVSKDDHLRGDKNAKVTIVEYSDMECPFCQSFHVTMQQVMTAYAGKVNWVYRHFPLDSLHPEARGKAEAAECVADLGGNDAFWKFIDADFGTPGFALANVTDAAAAAGVDAKKFADCYNAKKFATAVQDDATDAASAGANGTPYSVIIGADGSKTPINGAIPFERVKVMLDAIVK